MTLSIFDRLTPPSSHINEDIFHHDTTKPSSDLLLSNILLNIECILQTRCFFMAPPPLLTELNVSLITYGIEDFSDFSIHSEHDLTKACSSLEKALTSFEPRLKNIRVTLKNKQLATFSVNAELRLDMNQNDNTFLELILVYSDTHYTTRHAQFNKMRS